MIKNPILPGFNPDPSIIRVEDTYYIATSTFEWFPGIRLYRSKDLKNWEHFNDVLTRKSQLNLQGFQPSKGVWAPCLSYDVQRKRFYVVYSLVKSTVNEMFDQDNYMVYTDDIQGQWSEPIYLNSSGFDPSLFHDDDGKKYLILGEYDYRKGYELPQPGPIIIQELDGNTNTLMGEPKRIYNGGTRLWCIEGAHLYKRDDYYYMITAEGGTGYGHGVVVARAKDILGPYEPDPYNPIITSAKEIYSLDKIVRYTREELYNEDLVLQKSGHGSLVETPFGELYIAHLCSRPLLPKKASVLGRETALQKVEVNKEGWIRLKEGGRYAEEYTEEPINTPQLNKQQSIGKDDFNEETLHPIYNTLREPFDQSWGSLTERKGYLRLRGRDSLASTYDQSLVARRVTAFVYQGETKVEFETSDYRKMAGLVLFYDHRHYYYLRIYYSESLKSKCIGIMTSESHVLDELLDDRVPINSNQPVYLKAMVKYSKLQFYYSLDGDVYENIGPVLDASYLSDEHANIDKFTGTFIGVCCQDLRDKTAVAEFDFFSYREL